MNIFDNFMFYVILYLIFTVSFNQSYKVITKNMKKAGSLSILVDFLGGIIVMLFIPFFKIKFPTDIKIYILYFIAIIFYCLNDRFSTTGRSGIEASTYSIIKQLHVVFMIIAGLVFFKEPFVLTKIIGSILIILSNIFIFYKKGFFKFNKYIACGIIANICMSIALLIDVNLSNNFNLAIYISISLIISSILIFVFERINISDIKDEYNNSNKKILLITATSRGVMMILKLTAFSLGNITITSTLISLSVILDVIVGYIVLKERDNLIKKIIAAIVIILSLFLIKI